MRSHQVIERSNSREKTKGDETTTVVSREQEGSRQLSHTPALLISIPIDVTCKFSTPLLITSGPMLN
jgi:hypothetical protein